MSTLPALRDGEQKLFFQAGGEWCYLWTPTTFRADRPTPVVIHHHGAGGYVRDGSADWLDESFKVAFLRGVMHSVPGGCAFAGNHACGDHWGNDCGLESNLKLYATLAGTSQIDATRIGMMGGGLGGALIWNTVATLVSAAPSGARPIKAVAVMQAIASLESMIRAGKFKANCLGGHSVSAEMAAAMDDDEAVARIAPHDPLPKLRKLPAATHSTSRLPTAAIYHGAVDENVLPEGNAIPLAQALTQAGADVTLELFPGVGHATYDMGKPLEDRLAAFFRSAL